MIPGLRLPAAQWRQAVALLRGVPLAPGLEVARAAVLADLNRYAARMPAFAELTDEQRKGLLKDVGYAEAPAGTVVLCEGEVSDAAYLILEGEAVAGREEDGRERVLDVPRTATMRALTRVAALALRKDDFDRLVAGHLRAGRVWEQDTSRRMMGMRRVA